jgi:hypothetical protein
VRAAALALGIALAAGGAPAAADTVAGLVFQPGRFARITEPLTLRYRLDIRGRGIEATPPSPARLEVRSVAADGAKEVWLDLFTGAARRQLGPVAAREQNPIVLVFLQTDVTEMGRLSGGAPGYFQQQIRKAFNTPAESETVTIALDGRELAARSIVIRPFQDDPQIDRFPAFRDKAYELTVADGVPGGLWRIVARTPDPRTGELVLEKALTFEAVER